MGTTKRDEMSEPYDIIIIRFILSLSVGNSQLIYIFFSVLEFTLS